MDPLLTLLTQHRAAGDDPPNLLWAADAAASVLFTLLCCVDSRRLVLNDADALRLLSAAPVVLRVQPQMLRMFAESFRSGDLTVQDLSEDLHPCRMMETNIQAVSLLVSALTEPEPQLPERALAAAQATSLRPQALKDWLCGPGSVLDTIAAFLFVVGERMRAAAGRLGCRAWRGMLRAEHGEQRGGVCAASVLQGTAAKVSRRPNNPLCWRRAGAGSRVLGRPPPRGWSSTRSDACHATYRSCLLQGRRL